ncbi:type IV pili methyl-accepting chemotaxis transducer N-terminal domain-containing protein [Actibacterium sp. 188UL27-1]|uniref:type IV pili methyl-accepting chemotaxis transducer N-terminal domain-containing protein n=1 Tax=Actibacterium sp. 188UL27-1 TaxID=2786961 RepID=UPI001959FA5B|nr:type IV pili methyl-accepting chemotaxis transducer N-terminal domain-containing protein [Actibacterium sp. 188UL27-1]MBM7066941.1 type IV pili methyl-accepting chemotaxis transducer N-terminal domain-containing protein [Actibacterium sp. 188UL27-1]
MFQITTKLPLKTRIASATLALMVGAVSPSLGVAQQDAVFDGSKARVNVSGLLGSITQRIGSGSCRIAAGYDVETAKADLTAARSDFSNIMNALRNGDPALGIPTAEDFSRVLNSLDKVETAWEPVEAASAQLLAGENVAEAAANIATTDEALLEATVNLAAEVTARYTNPAELLQGDAMSIGIAGRQRLFSQKMAMEVCGIASGQESFGTSASLSETVASFDRSLIALRDGEPSVGIAPPPSDAVAGQLSQSYDEWTERKDRVAPYMSDGSQPDATVVAAVVEDSDALFKDMNNAVTLYMLSTPGQEDVYRVPLQNYAKRELSKWLSNPELIAAINAQNAEHAALSLDQIDALDQDWRAEAKSGGGELITRLLSHPSSEWLRGQQTATAGFVTEVFVMDNRGLNVAQSVETSDYWQGDEAKWKQTYGNGSGEMHISEVEFDDSTQFFQSQVSLPISDPATGKLIGAITFGINVQSLL